MNSRTVLLYQPRTSSPAMPLGLIRIGSLLPDFDVRIIDGRTELTPESTLAELAERSLCLGVTVMTGKPIHDALRASRAAKRRNPALPVVWGGWHPTLLPAQCLASRAVDLCVRGQGEETFRDVVLALASGKALDGIPGTSQRGEGATVDNRPRPPGDPNSFPPANYGLIDVERYFTLRGARGLDYCSSTGPLFGLEGGGAATGPANGLAAARVVAEVADLVQRYRVEQVVFNDHSFFGDPRRAEAIARGLRDRRVAVRWRAAGRPDELRRMSVDQLQLIRESGCHSLTVNEPTGPPAGGAWPGAILETAEKLHAAGLHARFDFVAGVPDEPASALAATYRTVKALRKIDGAFETPISFYAPFPPASASPASGPELPRTLEEWGQVDDADAPGPWISEPVRKFVPRYNFYLRHAFEPAGRGPGKRLAQWLARLRVRFDFYRFDFERRLVDLSRRVRTGISARPR